MPPGGSGRIWLVFTGINAPVFRLTDRAQFPFSFKLKNPPGHKPSFWLSRLIVRSPRPPYCQAPLLPPLTTPCPIWVTFRSMVTPFSAHSLRRPPQSPVKVERDQRSPEYGSFGVVSCARTGAPREIAIRNITATMIVDLFMLLLLLDPSGFKFQVSGVRIRNPVLNLKPEH